MAIDAGGSDALIAVCRFALFPLLLPPTEGTGRLKTSSANRSIGQGNASEAQKPTERTQFARCEKPSGFLTDFFPVNSQQFMVVLLPSNEVLS